MAHNNKIWRSFLLAGGLATLGLLFPWHAASKKIHQRFTISKLELTQCVTAKAGKTVYRSLSQLDQTWLGNVFSQNMQDKGILVGTYPPAETQKTYKNKATFLEDDDLIALRADDLGSVFHESVHAYQKAPAAWEKTEMKTGAFQTLLAREIGAHCLTVLNAYQRSLNGDAQSWDQVQHDILPEVVASKILRDMVKENPAFIDQLRDATQKPPAPFVDQFMTRCLKAGILSPSYERQFYALEIKPLPSDKGIDFTPLSPQEIGQAVCGDLYPTTALPQTVQFLNDLGQQAATLSWFTQRIAPEDTAPSRTATNAASSLQTASGLPTAACN